MQKWEYLVSLIPEHVDNALDISDIFNGQYGANGWELVAVNNGVAYFKRPVKTKRNWEPLILIFSSAMKALKFRRTK